MRRSRVNPTRQAFTLIELLVVAAIVVVLTFLILPNLPRQHHGCRINCTNNLKQIGLAFTTWALDYSNSFPMAVPVGKGGTRDLAAGPTVFFHFTVMSNELSTPKILLCPADANRVFATDFNGFGNSNISYFVGIDADDTVPQEFLAGDRNITNGSPVVNGILHLATNRPVGWTHEMHNRQGNVALADGSVQRFGNSRLNQLGSTNRLALP